MDTIQTLTLHLLGGAEVLVDGQPVEGLKTAKSLAMLVYLALTKRAHSRHELAGTFWSEHPEDKAKNSLRVALSALNKAVPAYIESDRLSVGFRHDLAHEIDVDQFLHSTQELETDTNPDPTAMQQLLDLYHGDFLLDFHVTDAPEFEAWQLGIREACRQSALTLAEHLSDSYLQHRSYPQAVEALGRLLELEPWSEEAHRRLMLSYARMGRFNRALLQYEQCRQVLQDEFDVPPMPETHALYERIRVARENPAPELPANAMPFVGREHELVEIGSLLREDSCRLVTIVGLGGSGKTRLAIESCRQANQEHAVEFINGVRFVSLSDVDDAGRLPAVLLNALQVAESGRSTLRDELLSFLENKELLLALDNFEQLLDGVVLVADILQNAPGVKLLITSREPLSLAHEWRVDLTGMTYPSAADEAGYDQYDAVQLFVNAAQQVLPSFVLTDDVRVQLLRLCCAVDGVPLALCLAAPWLRATSLDQIVQEVEHGLDILESRMRDTPSRQRSLRVVFEQSWERLAPDEQHLLAQLSVFRGGYTLEAARSVADATLLQMVALVDRAFLRYTEGDRYEVHALIRQFAAEKLEKAESGDEMQAHHSRYYTRFAQDCYHGYLAGEYPQMIAVMSDESLNLRAAWTWLVESVRNDATDGKAVEQLASLVHPLAWYLHKRVRYAEGIELLEIGDDALSAALSRGQLTSTQQRNLEAVRARLRVRLAMLLYYRGEYDRTQALIEAVLPLLHAEDLVEDEAMALHELCKYTRRRGDLSKTKELIEGSNELYSRLGNAVGQMQNRVSIAVVAADEEDYLLAEEAGREAVAFYRDLNDTPSLVLVQSNLANTYIRQRKYAEAEPLLLESIELARGDNNRFSLMMASTNLSLVAQGYGDLEKAEFYSREALTHARTIGDQRWTATNLNSLSRISLDRDRWNAGKQYALSALEITRALQSEMDILSDLSCLARAWVRQGDGEDALHLLLCMRQYTSMLQQDKDQNRLLLKELTAKTALATIARIEEWCETVTLDEVCAWALEKPESAVAHNIYS